MACMLLPGLAFSQSTLKEKWTYFYQNKRNITVINDMIADSAGNVYTTGYFIKKTGTKKFFATKANEKGVQQWVRFYPFHEADTSQAGTHIVADDKGNVWVTGNRFNIEFSTCTTYASRSVFCIRYNQNGDIIYHTVAERQEDNTGLYPSVCYDNKENVYLTIRQEIVLSLIQKSSALIKRAK